ncbi:MAG: XdhC family protein [Candidatus Cloacimonadales bacterium]
MDETFIDILNLATVRQKEGIPFVLATIVEGEAGSPGRTGFKVIVMEDGSFEGTVGGGKLEQLILAKCAEIHQSRQNALQLYELKEDGIGMACGGRAQVFFEYYPAQRRAFLFGAGHTCRSISPLLKSIGFQVVVIDNRPEFARSDLLPAADQVVCSDYQEFISEMKPGKNDAAIIFTHGHQHDHEILQEICRLNLPFYYLGMIGSKAKVSKSKDLIVAQKYAGNLIEKVYAPIGLNIARSTTQEIAIAIVAEILAVYNQVSEPKFMSKR